MGLKTKGERLSEVITLLKRLIEVGIPDTDYGYKETKKILDAWLIDGEAREERVEFPRYGRVGHLSLFSDSGKHPVFVLKASL